MSEAKHKLDAMDRANQLAMMKQTEWPPLAFEIVRHLCKKAGGCGEVIFTGLSFYAQRYEGLDCKDHSYRYDERLMRGFNSPILSAAPDLLAACKRQIANIERWMETGVPAGPEESKSIYDQMVAAVAKAEGREP